MTRQKKRKTIAYQDGTVALEDLPLPRVLYPGHYGTFFGFQATENSPIYLCACMFEALENYLKFQSSHPIPQYVDKSRVFMLGSLHFPTILINSLKNREIEDSNTVLKYLLFREGICHECNQQTPSYRYCHEMYGGIFKQTYGWYINKQGYEYGVEPISDRILPEVCPQKILDLLEMDPNTYPERRQQLATKDFYAAYELDKRFSKQKRRIWRAVENEVRLKFGHKKVGEAWTSETILYYLVRSFLPNKTILRHYRPEFLERLELDIYIPELKIGIEYQGIQHYRPVKHWGGEKALMKCKERDKRKRQICEDIGIKLIYFKYDEHLTSELVEFKLRPHL